MRVVAKLFAAVVAGSAVISTAAAAGPPATGPASLQLFADSRVVAGPRVTVEVVGHGPDVVLVPGLACSREVWRHTAERLRDRYTLHLVQVAGFAGQPAGDNAKGPVLEPVEEAVDAYVRAAHLAPATVVGHSAGGTMALMLAERHPADVRRALLVDALPFVGVLMAGPTATADALRPTAGMLRDQLTAPATPDARRAATSAQIARMVTAPADVDRVVGWSLASDRAVVAQALYDDVLTDLRPDLAKTAVPVTLVYPYDAVNGVPLAAWDAVYHGQFAPLPHATLVRVDASRHFVMLDQPAKFDAALDAFLGGK